MSDSQKTWQKPALLAGAVVTFAAALALGRWVVVPTGPSGGPSAAPNAALVAAMTASTQGPRFKIPVSMSQPKLGADDAPVTIVEWGDFRSEASRHARDVLNALLAKHPGELRVVHRQLPTPTDAESMRVNYFARAAFDLGGKFWEVRDRLLDAPLPVPLTDESLRTIAGEVGLDWDAIERGIAHKDFARYVGVDVLFAGKFGVNETPAFFVNGRRAPTSSAAMLQPTLEALFQAELVNAGAQLAHGVDGLHIYDAVIEDGLWSTDDDPVARRAARAAVPQGMPKGP